MGGLFNNPPPGGGDFTDVPVPDFQAASMSGAVGAVAGGLWDDLVNKWQHSHWDAITWVGQEFLSLINGIMSYVVQIYTFMQNLDQPGYFKLIGSVMSDLMGVEFSQAAIQASFQQRGELAAMQTIGGDIFDTLAREFSASQTPGSPNATTSPAKAFLGFLTSFSVRQGNIEFFSELIPEQWDIIRGVRRYGELLAESLGLGRLARRAFQPLVQILIAEPLTYALNQQYRPKLLSEDIAIRSYIRGGAALSDVQQWLAWQGYSDTAINALMAEYARAFTPAELIDLQRIGQMDDATAISLLQQAGMDQGTANRVWTAHVAQAANGIVHQQATVILSQHHQGLIDLPTASGLIDQLPMTPFEILEYKHLLGTRQENGWRALSESEMERAFLGGIIDVTTIQNYWQGFGYRPDAIQILTLLLLQKQAAGNRTAGGHTPHKNLTEAELEKAFKAGILTLPQLQAEWTALGYNANSIQILTALVTAPPA